MDDICKIYLITNSINNKVYVGQTWRSTEKRLKEHEYANSRCIKLINALKKYGVNNFNIQVIDTCFTQNDADTLEIKYINAYNSIESGYNIRYGGSRGKLSEQTKKSISISHIGKKHSEATLDKMSKTRIGHKTSTETRVKMSKSKIGELHPLAKLTWEIVRNIRTEYKDNKTTYRKLASKYGINFGSIGKIINNLIWKE